MLAPKLRGVFFVAHVVVLPLRRTPIQAHEDNLAVRIATRDELYLAARRMPMQLTEGFVDASLARGDLCAAAFDEDVMVGFMWASLSGAPLDDHLRAEVRPPFTYGYKSFVLPQYRGRRILAKMAEVRDQASLERGRDFNVAYIETHNFASYQSALHAGTRHCGFVGYVRVLGRCYPFRTLGARRTTLRLVRR